MNPALQDPRENILVQPGDVLILQETPVEAVASYQSDVVSFDFFAQLPVGVSSTSRNAKLRVKIDSC